MQAVGEVGGIITIADQIFHLQGAAESAVAETVA
jgi:hypothetical protein